MSAASVTATEVVQLAHMALTGFDAAWAEHEESDFFEDGATYLHVAVVGRHLVARMQAGATDEIAAFFDMLEQAISEGRAPDRNLIASGLFETTQNWSLHNNIPLEEWDGRLPTDCLYLWNCVIGLWSGKLSGEDYNEAIAKSPRKL
jgi:hypothetical protein